MSCRFSSLFPILAVLLAAACSSYDFTINEKLVYSPKPLFSDYSATDPALHSCLEQSIAEQKASSAADLQILNCSHAGVTELEGLAVFTGISELAALPYLEVLHLENNQIVDLRPLLELHALRELRVSGNPGIQCASGASLIVIETLALPEHCL